MQVIFETLHTFSKKIKNIYKKMRWPSGHLIFFSLN